MNSKHVSRIEEHLQSIKRAGGYRQFKPLALARHASGSPYPCFLDEKNRPVIHFALNDYLGMSQSDAGRQVAISTINSDGVGAGGSRNIGGTRRIHEELEAEMMALHRREDALILGSGNVANADPLISLEQVFQGNAHFFSDSDNHASIIDGLKSVDHKRKTIFRNNDPSDLRRLVKAELRKGEIPILVAESIYSMTGHIAPLKELVKYFKDQVDGLVVINEVHAVGVIGDEGEGYLRGAQVERDVDLVTGTFAKAYGVRGGYIAGDRAIVDLVRQTGRRAIFSTATSPVDAAASLANVRHLRASQVERQKLRANLAALFGLLKARGILETNHSEVHIVPIMVYNEARAVQIEQHLWQEGFYVSAVRFPTVPPGKALLRVTVTPRHTPEQIQDFVAALSNALTLFSH